MGRMDVKLHAFHSLAVDECENSPVNIMVWSLYLWLTHISVWLCFEPVPLYHLTLCIMIFITNTARLMERKSPGP
jgi:hypothetical protein